MGHIVQDLRQFLRLISQLPPEERGQLQGIGTPTFFIDGHILIGAQPFQNFKRLIDRELDRAERNP